MFNEEMKACGNTYQSINLTNCILLLLSISGEIVPLIRNDLIISIIEKREI